MSMKILQFIIKNNQCQMPVHKITGGCLPGQVIPSASGLEKQLVFRAEIE
jgi:hypothetical protein